MKQIISILLLLLNINAFSTTVIDKKTGVVIHFENSSVPFGHETFNGVAATYNIVYEQAVSEAISAYPVELVKKYLKHIYVYDYIGRTGFGGTYSTKNYSIYITVIDDQRNVKTKNQIQNFIHHEFSSMIWKWRRDGSYDKGDFAHLKNEWLQISNNYKDTYSFYSVYPEEKYWTKGYLCDYGTKSFEEDFNMIASYMFKSVYSEFNIWSLYGKYPEITEKMDLVIKYYTQIDSKFNKNWFENNCKKN
jgi:hypothetical protein